MVVFRIVVLLFTGPPGIGAGHYLVDVRRASWEEFNSNRKGKKMQATVNFTHNNARRGESHNDPSHHTARLFKRFGRRVPTLLPALLICLLAPLGQGMTSAQMSHSTNAAAPSEAQKAFEKMKAMVGSWQGSIMGISVNITIRVTSSGNAILHEATGDARPDDPITMFYLDGDRLLLTHFCDSGNRPRMEGKMSPDGKTVE
ncbi:MAG: hypothetical protein ACREAC_21870, partial [Blastocatellia bacterium]